MKKKITHIVTVFSDGSISVINPNEKVIKALDTTLSGGDDPDNDGDNDTGGESPTEPPGNP